MALPVYFDIAVDSDFTLYLTITTKQGPLIAAECRHRFLNGNANGSKSYT